VPVCAVVVAGLVELPASTSSSLAAALGQPPGWRLWVYRMGGAEHGHRGDKRRAWRLRSPSSGKKTLRLTGRSRPRLPASRPPTRWTILQRHVDHVLRTALVKPAMNSAANTYAGSRLATPIYRWRLKDGWGSESSRIPRRSWRQSPGPSGGSVPAGASARRGASCDARMSVWVGMAST
jgi:hypothetical protein